MIEIFADIKFVLHCDISVTATLIVFIALLSHKKSKKQTAKSKKRQSVSF